MKKSYLFLSVFVLIILGFGSGCKKNNSETELLISTESKLPAKIHDVISYDLSFASENELKSLEIITSANGKEIQRNCIHKFKENIYKGMLHYDYQVPIVEADINQITLTFRLKDRKSTKIKTSSIPIYKPPAYALNAIYGKDIYTAKILQKTKTSVVAKFIETSIKNFNPDKNPYLVYQDITSTDELFADVTTDVNAAQQEILLANTFSDFIVNPKIQSISKNKKSNTSELYEKSLEKELEQIEITEDKLIAMNDEAISDGINDNDEHEISADDNKENRIDKLETKPERISKVKKMKAPTKLKYTFKTQNSDLTLAYNDNIKKQELANIE